MATKKVPTAVRLSSVGKQQLEALADKLGVSQTAVIEMAVRMMAERERIPAAPVPAADADQKEPVAA